ncbi:MAG TPA: 50S ribosomal protein L9 [Candidatus Paceibacterota bacterium]|nr:50S ribosomal protein L9 [Candidatus Paceibacterota bacterium]
MKVIFLQNVPRVGNKHEIKEVNDGYATNFLFPRKLAEMATASAVTRLELRKKEVQVEKEIQEELLDKNLAEIKGKVVTISAKADEKGHLFSGIHKKEIADAMLKEHRSSIGEEYIVLEKPIKQVGEFEIPVEIKNKKSSFQLVVTSI